MIVRNLPESLHTQRLTLRRWSQSDVEPFAEMNFDSEVMEFFPKTLSLEESVDLIRKIEEHFEKNGFGLWAVEIKTTKEFIGFVGLSIPSFEAHFMPCIEIGWRIKRSAWGNGYATEAAKKVVEDGFTRVGLSEIVSFTSILNQRSIKVMERIGMNRDLAGDFLHPLVADESHLKAHILYRLSQCNWQKELQTIH